ncbi:MAG: protein kinase [Bacteroidota bacterium]|nr:protein kinase [Bacteroidota bacterium]
MDLSELGLDDEVKAFLNNQKDFQIDRVSQEGGNCDIFFGYHNIFQRRIALKVYYGSDKSSSHYEPRILSKIEHDNILRVRDAKRIGNYYSYFMTDEISGGDLEKCLEKGDLDLKDKLNIIHGVLNGLTELHNPKYSIVHRDIKPKNILIYQDSKQPLISDFGSIKKFDKSLGKVSGSKTTLVYTPKEVFESNQYTTQSDIYQVGVTMFQILGGYFPGAYFDWLTDKEKQKFLQISGHYEQSIYLDKVIQKLVTRNKLLRYETLPPYLNSTIIKVIKKATNPRLKIRYANTGEFMKDLFIVQKRLINWKENDSKLYATKMNGDEFRIVESKKGFSIEKKGKNGWRRNGEYEATSEPLIMKINKN